MPGLFPAVIGRRRQSDPVPDALALTLAQSGIELAIPDPGAPAALIAPVRLLRNSGTTGSVIVSGGVPLPAGALAPDQLDFVALWLGGSEVACHVQALEGTYPDGSLIAVRIQHTRSMTVNTDVTGELRIGTPFAVARELLNTTAPRYEPNEFVVLVDAGDTRFFQLRDANYWPCRGQMVQAAAGTRLALTATAPAVAAEGVTIPPGKQAIFCVILGSTGPFLAYKSGSTGVTPTADAFATVRDPATGNLSWIDVEGTMANVYNIGEITVAVSASRGSAWVMGTDGLDDAGITLKNQLNTTIVWNSSTGFLRLDLPAQQSMRLPKAMLIVAGTASNGTKAEDWLVKTQMLALPPDRIGLTRAQAAARGTALGVANVDAQFSALAKTVYVYITGQAPGYFHGNADYDPAAALLHWYATTGDYGVVRYAIAWANMTADWMTDETKNWSTHRSGEQIDEPYFDVEGTMRHYWFSGHNGFRDLVVKATDVYVKRTRLTSARSTFEFMQYLPSYGTLETRQAIRALEGLNACVRVNGDLALATRLLAGNATPTGSPLGFAFSTFPTFKAAAQYAINAILTGGSRSPGTTAAFDPTRPGVTTAGYTDYSIRKSSMGFQYKPFMHFLAANAYAEHYAWVDPHARVPAAIQATYDLALSNHSGSPGPYWSESGSFFKTASGGTYIPGPEMIKSVRYDGNEFNTGWTFAQANVASPGDGGEPPDYTRGAGGLTPLAGGYPGSFYAGQVRNLMGMGIFGLGWLAAYAEATLATTLYKTEYRYWLSLLQNGDAADCTPEAVSAAEKQWTESGRWFLSSLAFFDL